MDDKGTVSLRDRVGMPALAIGMGIAFFLAILGLTMLMVWQNYRAAISAGEARAVSSAHVVAANLEWMIEASDQALRRIDSVFSNQPIVSSSGAADDIASAVSGLPVGFQYAVYDETGMLRLSSIPRAPVINIADRSYFQKVQTTEQSVISPQLVERVSKEQVFIIARRIKRDGAFHGAATIAIPVHKLVEFWSSMGLGEFSSIGVLGDDGWLVARYPPVPNSIQLKTLPLFDAPLKWQPNGFYHSEISPVDHKARIVGFWRLSKWPLIAVAGIERTETLDIFWKTLRQEIVFGLPMIALLLIEAVSIAALLRAYVSRNRDLEKALERNNFLFREIHHRVKNNLQAVSALVRLQPLPDQARKEMVHRISAMIAVHEQIYQSDQFDRLEAAPYLTRVVTEIAKAYNRDVDVRFDLEPIHVDRDQALPIGLIVNEVVSNAFKYAFTEGQTGILDVRLRQESGHAVLTIVDDGPGFDPEGAAKGMGSKLIAGFVAQLGGRYSFERDGGTVFTMTIPVVE
ncbi:histidine kinase dimerization/phosphoacceptor domain -containing protein [Gellertiella hungarica]|uniref:histidine kinase n=1 Tax=Gellertiella hungarica TaxID=1572859 RepID=A0A7W6JB39_9HYPH|nr:two-component sensor histidine kinase [Gellertiella hungarica]